MLSGVHLHVTEISFGVVKRRSITVFNMTSEDDASPRPYGAVGGSKSESVVDAFDVYCLSVPLVFIRVTESTGGTPKEGVITGIAGYCMGTGYPFVGDKAGCKHGVLLLGGGHGRDSPVGNLGSLGIFLLGVSSAVALPSTFLSSGLGSPSRHNLQWHSVFANNMCN